MPQPIDFGAFTCSIARGFALLGESWTPLVIRDVYCGITRFDALCEDLGVARSVLSRRLARLVDAGVLSRERYSETHPRDEYRLTPMGLDLVPAVMAVMAWGDRWLDEGEGPPAVLRHERCGRDMVPTVCCSECGDPLDPGEVVPHPGPGARRGFGTMIVGDAMARAASSGPGSTPGEAGGPGGG
jgi:DNA-binding HxlR family transcriptional regulator